MSEHRGRLGVERGHNSAEPEHDRNGIHHVNRRRWLVQQGQATLGLAMLTTQSAWTAGSRRTAEHMRHSKNAVGTDRIARQAEPLDVGPWQALARRAVEAALAAGAQYCDARLTRRVRHEYKLVSDNLIQLRPGAGVVDHLPSFIKDEEVIGIGVRALVNGYWGFTAGAQTTPDAAAQLAQGAVGQAKTFAKGPPWTVDLGQVPVATGVWSTPVRIDPFAISIDEKLDLFAYWNQCAIEAGVPLGGIDGSALFVRDERVVATSEGSLFSQTLIESGARMTVGNIVDAPGLGLFGAGWEVCLDANVPEWFLSGSWKQEIDQIVGSGYEKPFRLGKYTLVCDGATMASLVEATLGVATQLDRALGYEANANGTGWWTDPLAVAGTEQVAVPLVTLTANRSTPRDLATVKWDDEGVEPAPFTLIKDGVLVDFQTTREQAAWLAPYYQKEGKPVRSHGCAAAESAHMTPMQLMPNLSLEPGASTVQVKDLVADVGDGIWVEGGLVTQVDSQARTGVLLIEKNDRNIGRRRGYMREIRNGRLGKPIGGGAILWDSKQLWKHVKSVGGPATQMAFSRDRGLNLSDLLIQTLGQMYVQRMKGQPGQTTSYTVRAPAAVIENQPMIDLMRRA